jgi:hypothetical protein
MNKTQLHPPLVFVETGRKPSKYLLNNLRIHGKLFPDRKIVLIVSAQYKNYVDNPDIEIISEESLPLSSLLSEFEGLNKQWTGLQKNYWSNTTKRFFILDRYMQSQNMEKLIHLESDCILLDDSEIQNEFNKDNWGLRYPKQHTKYGCASLLLINKADVFESFLKYVLENWERGEITDMDLLGEFVDLRTGGEYLPSADLLTTASKSIYDAGSIGRYFLGSDARNCRLPFSGRGLKDNAEGALKILSPKIILNAENKLIYKDTYIPDLELKSIHIHSKRIPNKYRSLVKMITKDSNSNNSRFWTLGAFDYLVFLERLISFIYRRFLMNKSQDFRFR